MLKKSNAIFVTVVLALASVYALIASVTLIIFLIQERSFPISMNVGFGIWFLGVILSVICVIIGSYLFFKYNKIFNFFIVSYLILTCLTFKVYEVLFAWFVIRLDFTVGISNVGIGINFAGIPLLVWYLILMIKKP